MWISIDEHDSRPIYLQIIYQIKQQIRQGTLSRGTNCLQLGNWRAILGINMHTTRSAYLKLEEQKVISLRPGRRAIINRLMPSSDKLTQADLRHI